MKSVFKSIISQRLLIVLTLGILTSPLSAKEHLKFGVVPQSSGSKLAQQWAPILHYLEDKTGYEIEFATARNIPTFEQRLHDGKYDIAYMNPYHYTKVNASAGYQAFARAKDKRLQGILVVQKDSPYRELKDLAGAEIAFPSNAFAADQVPRAYFNQLGIDITPRFVASHDSVYRNVAKGRYPAGGGVLRTFNNTAKEFHDNLRILWTSEEFTPHAFAAHPRVNSAAVQRLQQVMLDMERDPKGQKLLNAIQIKAIETGQDRDWDDVRRLKITD